MQWHIPNRSPEGMGIKRGATGGAKKGRRTCVGGWARDMAIDMESVVDVGAWYAINQDTRQEDWYMGYRVLPCGLGSREIETVFIV